MNDKIVIDIKDGARSGEIKIKHQNGEFHLFGVKARKPPIIIIKITIDLNLIQFSLL